MTRDSLFMGRGRKRAAASQDELKKLRSLLYEVMRELPTSTASVSGHADLQRLHRRAITLLGEEQPGEFVRSDYWLGRFNP